MISKKIYSIIGIFGIIAVSLVFAGIVESLGSQTISASIGSPVEVDFTGGSSYSLPSGFSGDFFYGSEIIITDLSIDGQAVFVTITQEYFEGGNPYSGEGIEVEYYVQECSSATDDCGGMVEKSPEQVIVNDGDYIIVTPRIEFARNYQGSPEIVLDVTNYLP